MHFRKCIIYFVEKEINVNTENYKRKRENKEKKGEKRIKNYRVKYIGESWRTGYERGREHKEDIKELRICSLPCLTIIK